MWQGVFFFFFNFWENVSGGGDFYSWGVSKIPRASSVFRSCPLRKLTVNFFIYFVTWYRTENYLRFQDRNLLKISGANLRSTFDAPKLSDRLFGLWIPIEQKSDPPYSNDNIDAFGIYFGKIVQGYKLHVSSWQKSFVY